MLSQQRQRRIEIVTPRAWRPVLDAELHRAALAEDEQAYVRAALRCLHDLHIGITPQLCVELAALLRNARHGRPPAGLFSPLIDHLESFASGSTRETGVGGRSGGFGRGSDLSGSDPGSAKNFTKHDPGQRSGLLVATGTFYFLLRVIGPLVKRAGDDLGVVYLFAAGPQRSERTQTDFRREYGEHARRLQHRLQELLEPGEIPELFWAERALTLAGLAHPRASAAGAPADLSQVDEVCLAHLQRIRPELERREQERRPPRRPLTVSARHRPLLHHNEGGVDGIHVSRRLADLHCMLLSELLNPAPLLLDRLVSSGYLALRRPPRMEKRRDVLIAGILPFSGPRQGGGLRASGMAIALAKAGWLDWVMQVSLWLQRIGLGRSELLWIEGDRFGRMATSRCLLHQLPGHPGGRRGKPPAAYRNLFLTGLGWIPGYLDRHAPASWPTAEALRSFLPKAGDRRRLCSGAGATDIDLLTRWAAAAWRSQRDCANWQQEEREGRSLTTHLPPGSGGATSGLRWQDFGTVHLMLFLPRQRESEVHASWSALLQHRFGLPPEAGCSLTVTWLPAEATDCSINSGWQVSSRGKHRHITRGAGGERDGGEDMGHPIESQIAGRLESIWMELLFEEAARG